MPIENELKFVLKPSIEYALSTVSNIQVVYIDQGYIGSSNDITCRVRSTYNRETKEQNSFFTAKTKGPTGITEIETSISEKDCRALFLKCNKILTKVRFCYGDWEIDIFQYYGKNLEMLSYFWMAEIEMPEGQESPSEIPELISNHLLFAVPREDNRFTSKKLADVDYAKNLFKYLTIDTNKENYV
jgi:CYTH domain-containing protein